MMQSSPKQIASCVRLRLYINAKCYWIRQKKGIGDLRSLLDHLECTGTCVTLWTRDIRYKLLAVANHLPWSHEAHFPPSILLFKGFFAPEALLPPERISSVRR